MILFISIIIGVGIVYVVLQDIHEALSLKMIICVIRPEQLGDVVSALRQENLIEGMTVMNVRGFGRQKAETGPQDLVEEETIRFLPKLKLEILMKSPDVPRAIEVIGGAVRTGQIGDGKIIALKAIAVVQIHTGERGHSAL